MTVGRRPQMWLRKHDNRKGGKRKMRNIIRIIGVSLAAMAGILLVSGVAWAQALKTEIEGELGDCYFIGEPDKDWMDEDGVRHIRGQKGRCDHVGEDVFGRGNRGEFWVEDRDVDGAAGTQFRHGTSTFGGRILGDRVQTTGHYTIEGTQSDVWTFTVEHVWHLEDGRLLKISATWIAGDPITFTGILLDPPGLGPVKRNGPRRR
jgi:hypothetical protein